ASGVAGDGRHPDWIGAVPIVVLVAAGVLGFFATGWINAAGGLQIATFGELDWHRIRLEMAALDELPNGLVPSLWQAFFEGLGPLYRTAWVGWCLAMLWLSSGVGRRRGSPDCVVFLARWSVLAVAATTAATFSVAVGVYAVKVSHAGILFVNRYLTGLYLWPVLSTAVLLPELIGPRRASAVARGVLAITVAVGLLVVADTPWPEHFPRRPGDVECLDRLAERHGLRSGLGHFYTARRITVFSRRGLHVDQVGDDLRPMTWIDNRARRGTYDFVLTKDLGADATRLLGEPDSRAECGSTVLIYERPRPYPSPGSGPGPSPSPASSGSEAGPSPLATKATDTKRKTAPTGATTTPSPGSPP
ncbi:MAG: hypothetical protein MI919_12190, partial [Holophagales bacterium]|nr:hypothetical protein [Holophagales bacterium]